MVQGLKDGMLVGTADSVQFRNAPIYMKEALTFPYRYGIDFIAEVLIKGGKEKAFAELFQESSADHAADHGAADVSFRRAPGADACARLPAGFQKL